MNSEIKNLDFWNELKLSSNEELLFHEYYLLIHEYNKVMNLTGIDDINGVYLKHFYDSITVSSNVMFKSGMTVADVGSGAGFPGIVLAILYPDVKFHLIEPILKRCNFLEIVKKKLCLNNVLIINKRSEEIFDSYDVVISRAVAKLNILLELCIPIVKVNGVFVAMKGKKANQEILDSKKALNKLDCKVLESKILLLPLDQGERMNIVIQKMKQTDKKYPRNYSQIKSKPL